MTIFLIAFAVLLVIGVPISISIGASAVLGCLSLGYPLVVIGQKMVSGIDSFLLIAVPLFILAGNLMNQGGIAKRLVDFVMALLGKMPGALLVTNVGANALFGAISGSASAAAAAVGSMVQQGEEEQGL